MPYETMCRLAGVCYVEYDARTQVTRCDETLLRRLGLDTDRPASSDEWMARIHPDDLERIARYTRAVIAGAGATPSATPHPVVRLRGANGWRRFRVVLSMPDGDEPRLVAILIDITGETDEPFSTMRAAEMYEEVWRSLPGPVVSDLAWQRGHDHLAHVQRLTTMNELAMSIAHELNQPLTTIVASASAARRLLDVGDRAELYPILEDILEAASRAAKVMRTASAIVRGHASDREPVELNEIVGAVMRFVASNLVIHQVRTSVSLVPHCPPIVGDRIQLQQVILNLLLNAIEAVAEQPIGQRCISVATTLEERGQVGLVVSDTGRGVAPEVAARVFDPFVTTKHEGTGLGLAIVRSVVEAHGGHVVFEAPSEGGAAFRVTLPYGTAKESDRDQTLADVFAPGASRNCR